jgi:hypothetical protein
MQKFFNMKNLQVSLIISLLVFGQGLSAQDKNSSLEVIKKYSKDCLATQAGAVYGTVRGLQGAYNETLQQVPRYSIDYCYHGVEMGRILGWKAFDLPFMYPCTRLGGYYGSIFDHSTLSDKERTKDDDNYNQFGVEVGIVLGACVPIGECRELAYVSGMFAGTVHGVAVGGVNGLQQGAQEGYDAVQNIEKLTSGNQVVETAAWFGAASAVPAVVGAICIYREPIKHIIQDLLK